MKGLALAGPFFLRFAVASQQLWEREIQVQHKPKGVSIICTETISCGAHRDLRQLDVESNRLYI